MPKDLVRYQQTGYPLHFITFSCHRRQQHLGVPAARNAFERSLESMRVRYDLLIHGYVRPQPMFRMYGNKKALRSMPRTHRRHRQLRSHFPCHERAASKLSASRTGMTGDAGLRHSSVRSEESDSGRVVGYSGAIRSQNSGQSISPLVITTNRRIPFPLHFDNVSHLY